MRVIKKSEVRKIIIGHVELTLIFLFDYLLCKIAILESLKVLFLDKKQKLLSVDGKGIAVAIETTKNGNKYGTICSCYVMPKKCNVKGPKATSMYRTRRKSFSMCSIA